MRNLVIGYIIFFIIILSVWWTILPTQEELFESESDIRFRNVVRSLEVQITSRYGGEEIAGNLSVKSYTYKNSTVFDYILSENNTKVTLFFEITSRIRVKRFGLIIDEYLADPQYKAMDAYLEGEFWVLDITSARDIEPPEA
jgi:hypothetical protein